MKNSSFISFCMLLCCFFTVTTEKTSASTRQAQYADAHMHNVNFAGQGAPIKGFIRNYGKGKVVRSVLMPVPLHQKWDAYDHYANGQMPPNYYRGPKGELYYDSILDALVAKEYYKLSSREKSKLDPMITGFNPMDLYATEQIKRLLIAYPGVFSGIGEFTIHKEIVSNKITGQNIQKLTSELPEDLHQEEGTMTLYNPSLVKMLQFTGESGLVSVMHNDIYEANVSPEGELIARKPEMPYTQALTTLCKAAPEAKVIWAHTGLARYVKPTSNHLQQVSNVLDSCPNWSVDISWDVVQNWILHGDSTMPSLKEWTQFITHYQDRVLWGTDTVLWSANTINDEQKATLGKRLSPQDYQNIVSITDPLWEALGPEVSEKVRIRNYERLYNTARKQVRLWEKKHKNDDLWNL
jgi:Amidohydrolase